MNLLIAINLLGQPEEVGKTFTAIEELYPNNDLHLTYYSAAPGRVGARIEIREIEEE